MKAATIRVGFVPTHRFGMTPWCEQMRQQSLSALGAIAGLELVAPTPAADGQTVDAATGTIPHGSVQTLDQAQALADWFATQRLDGLIVCPLDFGDERSAAKVAERLGLPVLLYATNEPPAREDASLARVSDSYCGNLALAAALKRRGLRYRWAGLHLPGDSQLRREVEHFLAALAVGKALDNARIGQVGLRPPPFESVAYDELAMARKWGQNVIVRPFDDITRAAYERADDDEAVRATVSAIREGVAEVTVADDALLRSAKLELELASWYETNRLSGLAMQCWPQKSGVSLCALMGRLTGRGMLTACETDVLGALSMLVSQASTLHRTVPHLIDWTIRHRELPNRVLAWHCGNAPACLARDRRQTALRSRRDMTGQLGPQPNDAQAGLYQFELKPGPVTLCRLTEFDGAWRMLITRGTIVPTEELLAGTWAWVELADHDRLYRTLVEEGFIHHASMIHGDQSAALELACKFLDVEPIHVA